jgi:hypothetical protein
MILEMKPVASIVRGLGEVDDLRIAQAKKTGNEKSKAGLIA